jgi:hypothetical protein
MSLTLPNPRLVAVLGLALAALVAFLVARPLILSDDESTGATPAVEAPSAAAPSTQAQSAPATKARAGSKRIALLPGLPAPVAKKLRFEQVVVVALYSAKAPLDRKTVTHARVGAKTVDAGFVAVNVLNERKARLLGQFADASESPAVIVVRRPGRVVSQFNGFVDAAIVAQAAQNAGAGKKTGKKNRSK